MIGNIYWSSDTVHSNIYSCQISMKYESSGQIFEKFLNVKFDENPFSGSRIVPCGQTDGQT